MKKKPRKGKKIRHLSMEVEREELPSLERRSGSGNKLRESCGGNSGWKVCLEEEKRSDKIETSLRGEGTNLSERRHSDRSALWGGITRRGEIGTCLHEHIKKAG